jgi:hypothetical protein
MAIDGDEGDDYDAGVDCERETRSCGGDGDYNGGGDGARARLRMRNDSPMALHRRFNGGCWAVNGAVCSEKQG